MSSPPIGGGLGQPGEKEITHHGLMNDIIVPTHRWLRLLMGDEVMIAAAMLLLPIGYTVVGKWVLPIAALAIACLLFRNLLDGVEDSHTAAVRLGYASFFCVLMFAIGALFKDVVWERLTEAGEAIWQWPPRVGLFLYKTVFVFVPFFLPIFFRTPLLTRFFKTTLLDPTWPSPRAARDVGGVQVPRFEELKAEVEPPPARRVRVEVKENGNQTTIGDLPDTWEMRTFAFKMLNGGSFSEAESGLSRDKWIELRDLFLARHWARWRDRTAHQQGLDLTAAGRTALLAFVDDENTVTGQTNEGRTNEADYGD